MDVDSPKAWFARTEAYAGILQHLATENKVVNIKRINYTGLVGYKGVGYIFPGVGKRDTHFPFKLSKYIKTLKPDVVLVQGLHVPVQTMVLRKVLGKKVKIIAQNHAERPMRGLKKYVQRLADRCINAYLFASNELGAEWVVNGNISSSRKIHEVMEVSSVFSPMDKALAREHTGVQGEPVFLWVGRLNENKDPLTVVKAFLRFAEIKPLAHLYMIYHTEELLKEINELLRASPQKRNVTLVGQVSHEKLQCWFSSADVILSGSYYEGSGTAVCEAMSCGCMPVVTDIASFRMITDQGKCGLLYEPGNEEALLCALEQTLEIDMTKKQRLSLDFFKTNLCFEAIAGKIQAVASTL